MVNVKNAIAFGLLAVTASAASVHKDKRHAHHRRHNKPACTTPYPVGNSTVPAGTGVPIPATTSSTSSEPSVVTVSVIPVPVNPTTQPNGGTTPGTSTEIAPSVAPSVGTPGSPAGCGVATTYVTVQQTVTVTAGQPSTTSSTTPVIVVPPPAPTTTPSTTAPAPSAPAMLQTGTIDTPVQPTTTPAAAPPPPAASSPAASSPVSGGSYSGKKMGTSWDPNQTWLFSALGINVGASWVYDWGQVAHGVPGGVEYVPTLHDQSKCQSFASDVEGQSGVTYLKHFNEPDMSGNGGSGLPVSQAASLHNQYIAGLGQKYQLGLPAVTSNNIPGTSGTGWLEAFVSEVGCKDFSFGDFHFYGGTESAEQQAEIFLGYVDNWIQTLDSICPGKNLPVWISEFSAGPDLGDIGKAAAFMAVAGPKLESNPRVARYAYFFPQNTEIAGALASIISAIDG